MGWFGRFCITCAYCNFKLGIVGDLCACFPFVMAVAVAVLKLRLSLRGYC
jgi:hypothetical protein